jgi:hypothetical protein
MIYFHQKSNNSTSIFYVSTNRNKIFPHFKDPNIQENSDYEEQKKRFLE